MLSTRTCILAAAFAVVSLLAVTEGSAQAPTGESTELQLQVIDPDTERVPTASAATPRVPGLSRRLDMPRRLDLTERIDLSEQIEQLNIGREEDRKSQNPRVTMADGREVVVPLRLNFTMSADRKTLLQYGDALMRMHPMRTDLFWIGENREITARVQNRFDGGAHLDISENGFTAVGAPEYFAAREAANANQAPPAPIVDLYSPKGERLWTMELEKGTKINHLHALPDGQSVLVAIAPLETPLKGHELHILRQQQPIRGVATEFGILQKVVVLVEGKLAFIQGIEAHGLIDLATGGVRWRQPGKIRLISPEGAVVGPEGNRLFLMTGDRVAAEAQYRWTLSVLDVNSGKLLGQTTLDGTFPGTAGPVFEMIEDDRVTVRAGDKTLTVTIKQRG